MKKTYKRGSLFNAPNTGFTKIGKKGTNTLKPTKASMNVEQAQKLLHDTKGKIAPMPRYSVVQLKKMQLDQLIRLILLLQDENDRLRAELEKLRLKLAVADKKT